jgi:hypothetical protein
MKTPLEIAADNFHAHLDICPQCEGQPFQLCATGKSLLLAVGAYSRDCPADRCSNDRMPPDVMDVLEEAIRAIARRDGYTVDEASIRRARAFCNETVDPDTGEKIDG